jgi:sigma-B regulation protein RsbU (phosphoserine phosphatase)
MAILRIVANESNSSHIESARDAVGRWYVIGAYVAFLFFLLVLSVKLISARSQDSRRRVRVLLFGIALTLAPLLSLDAIARILHVGEDDLPAWLQIPVFPLVLSFPITIAYVTVVQRALDVLAW